MCDKPGPPIPFSHCACTAVSETKDSNIRVRISADLKAEVQALIEQDPDVQNMSEWVRREVRCGLEIRKKDLED